MEETTPNEEPMDTEPDTDTDLEDITEEEMQCSLNKLFLRYEQMLRNLAE